MWFSVRYWIHAVCIIYRAIRSCSVCVLWTDTLILFLQLLIISGQIKLKSNVFPVPMGFIIVLRLSHFNLVLSNSAVKLFINKFINNHELVAPMTIQTWDVWKFVYITTKIYRHEAHAVVTHSEGSPVGIQMSRVCSLTTFISLWLTEERCQNLSLYSVEFRDYYWIK